MTRVLLLATLASLVGCTSWQTVRLDAAPAAETVVTGVHGFTYDERNVRVRTTNGREVRVNAAIVRRDTVLAIGGVDTLRFAATDVERVQARRFDRTRSVIAGAGGFVASVLFVALLVASYGST